MAENREFDQQQDQLNQTPEQAQQLKDKPKTGEEMEQDGNSQLQEDVETAGQRSPERGDAKTGFVGSESDSDRSDDLINRDLDDQK
jgi:hypothetical protein